MPTQQRMVFKKIISGLLHQFVLDNVSTSCQWLCHHCFPFPISIFPPWDTSFSSLVLFLLILILHLTGSLLTEWWNLTHWQKYLSFTLSWNHVSAEIVGAEWPVSKNQETGPAYIRSVTTVTLTLMTTHCRWCFFNRHTFITSASRFYQGERPDASDRCWDIRGLWLNGLWARWTNKAIMCLQSLAL